MAISEQKFNDAISAVEELDLVVTRQATVIEALLDCTTALMRTFDNPSASGRRREIEPQMIRMKKIREQFLYGDQTEGIVIQPMQTSHESRYSSQLPQLNGQSTTIANPAPMPTPAEVIITKQMVEGEVMETVSGGNFLISDDPDATL